MGFVIPPGYAVIDLDNCFDGVDLAPATQTIVGNLQSYTERSPSGKGLHVIVKADLRGFSKLATTVDGQSTEVLTPGNFVTFTGLSLGRTMPEIIADCTSVLEQMYADAGVIQRMNKPQPVSVARKPQHQCSYGSKCLESECDRIRNAHVGSRTNSLLKGSYRIGRLIDHIDESVAVRELQRAGESTGLSSVKVSKTIADGLSEGKKNPRTYVTCEPIRITL